MTKINLFMAIFSFLTYSTSYAAIGCKPGMGGGCPADTPPAINNPAEGSTYLSIGYAEIASSNCELSDLAKAVTKAKSLALKEAQYQLGTKNIALISEHITHDCAQGIYANSAPGLSWIVQAYSKYTVK